MFFNPNLPKMSGLTLLTKNTFSENGPFYLRTLRCMYTRSTTLFGHVFQNPKKMVELEKVLRLYCQVNSVLNRVHVRKQTCKNFMDWVVFGFKKSY